MRLDTFINCWVISVSARNLAVWWDSGAGLGANGPQEAFVRLGQHRQGLQIR